jgi:hypothetical protein
MIMFRVRLVSGDIKTITKLLRTRFSSKEYLKTYLIMKSRMVIEAYNDSPVTSLIFSYIVKDKKSLRKEFIDNIREELAPIESKTFSHNFKNVKDIPIDVNLNLYGKILDETDSFKNISLPQNRMLNVIISNNDEGLEIRKFSLIKNCFASKKIRVGR